MGDNRETNLWKNLELLQAKSNALEWTVIALSLSLSILIHVAIYLFIPEFFSEDSKQNEQYETLELEILPPIVELQKLPEYIEANPYANKEKPKDSVTKESFQDQRAADMIVDVDSDSDKPFVDGEMEDSQKIVSGNNEDKPSRIEAMEISEIMNRDLAPPNLTEVSSNPVAETPVENLEKKAEENSNNENDFDGEAQAIMSQESSAKVAGEKTDIAVAEAGKALLEDVFIAEEMDSRGDIKLQEENLKDFSGKNSVSENVSEKYQQKGDSESDVSTQKQELIYEKREKVESQISQKPRSRPTINMKTIAGPLVDNERRASDVGIVAVDSSFSEFGAYQQRMLEAISRQWNLLASEFNLSNIVNTVVVVEFYLNSEGSLTAFRFIYSNSSEIGRSLCEQSIKSTSPYGKWTEDMLAVFGLKDQYVKITFHYR